MYTLSNQQALNHDMLTRDKKRPLPGGRGSTSYDIPTIKQECHVSIASCLNNVKNSFN
jgi:hypothetical protein